MTQDEPLAIKEAREIIQQDPIFLDTETTGLGLEDEIVELAIVTIDGDLLLNVRIQPTIPIPEQATRIHGITNEQIKNAPTFPVIWPVIRYFLNKRTMVIYNADYDTRMLVQSAAPYDLELREDVEEFIQFSKIHCAMKLYADFYGEWDYQHGNYRWQSLGKAAEQCELTLDTNLHNALEDAKLTAKIMRLVADFDKTRGGGNPRLAVGGGSRLPPVLG